MDMDLTDIGHDLLTHSELETHFSARGVIGSLFPYILQASKRLSTRAISRWLAEKHGVKISAVSISKALRNQDTYWDEYFDTIEPFAIAVENTTDFYMKQFLFDDELWHGLVKDQYCNQANAALQIENAFMPYGSEGNDDDELDKRWFNFDREIREAAYRVFRKRCTDDTESDTTNPEVK